MAQGLVIMVASKPGLANHRGRHLQFPQKLHHLPEEDDKRLSLCPLPVPFASNQMICPDLLGLLKSPTDKNYILGITDAFTKIDVSDPEISIPFKRRAFI